jgi:hypothetical protein
MAETGCILLVVSRSRLQTDLSKLLVLSVDDVDQNQLTEWRAREYPSSSTYHNLLEFVASGRHLKENDRKVGAGIKFSFNHALYQDKLTEINLSYSAYLDDMFDSSLDLIVLKAFDAHSGKNASFNLFHPAMRPALFKILSSLSVVLGYETTIDVLGDYNDDDYREHWQNLGILRRKDIELSRRDVFIVGKPLIPYFGLEELRKTQTFAKWEFPNQIFLYTSPFLFYKPWGHISEPATKAHTFSLNEVWREKTEFETIGEVEIAREISLANLEKSLELPKFIPYKAMQ